MSSWRRSCAARGSPLQPTCHREPAQPPAIARCMPCLSCPAGHPQGARQAGTFPPVAPACRWAAEWVAAAARRAWPASRPAARRAAPATRLAWQTAGSGSPRKVGGWAAVAWAGRAAVGTLPAGARGCGDAGRAQPPRCWRPPECPPTLSLSHRSLRVNTLQILGGAHEGSEPRRRRTARRRRRRGGQPRSRAAAKPAPARTAPGGPAGQHTSLAPHCKPTR